MPIKLIGRTTDFKGKPLWEILANLKNFGVGRIVVRNRFQRYPEPCYMKILKVAAMPSSDKPYSDRKVVVLVERVFRGLKNPYPSQLYGATYKADYMLIPKDQEHLYLQSTVPPPEKKILPKTGEFPPLYLQLLLRQMKVKDIPEQEQPKLPIKYNITNMDIKNYKIAEEGETPTMKYEYCIRTSSFFYPKAKATDSS
ncbi:uncharacterized protein LOC116844948 [Odontomachus brunneus]|uniref:uncharacterized protein LOC116844948 n=1 Tax=Odontomachus brunneus TaxID=486640 RepID=UPI0013F1E4B2|nr:uncharacterized protein LOC116844948 [Odontomachus brunneus]